MVVVETEELPVRCRLGGAVASRPPLRLTPVAAPPRVRPALTGSLRVLRVEMLLELELAALPPRPPRPLRPLTQTGQLHLPAGTRASGGTRHSL